MRLDVVGILVIIIDVSFSSFAVYGDLGWEK